mgnify:CR=1 FL=1
MKPIIFVILLLSHFSVQAQTSMFKNKGNQFNPAIGLNAMMLMQDSQVDSEGDGFSLQGVELQFNSDVDAYFRAQIVVGIHPEEHEDEHEEEGEEEHGPGYEVHPEEAYVETTSIDGVTFKAGKFLSQFGKYNAVHLHAQPFIYKGVVQEYMFGHEGFGSVGVSASFFIPSNWFSEITIEALQPQNEELFEESHHATAYVAKLKNLWDLSHSLTLEWGISGLDYKRKAYNDNKEESTSLVGSDLTFKWRPTKDGKSSSAIWSTEYIKKKRDGTVESDNGGITSFIRYQFKPRWFGQIQHEYLGINKSKDEESSHASTVLMGFVPSEFSVIRLQYDIVKSNEDEDEKRVSLQFNVSIGAHPAHTY